MKKQAAPQARDYLKIVEWSDEDQCYIGSAPPLIGRCCHGDDETKVYRDLRQIVEEQMALYAEDGKPLPDPTAKDFSGKFVLRIDPELHRYLAIRAMQEGESLNTFVVKRLSCTFSR